MSQISSHKNKTSVRNFINTLVIAGMLGFSPYSFAEDKKGSSSDISIEGPKQPTLEGQSNVDFYREVNKRNECRALKSDYDSAAKDLRTACKESGISGTSCQTKALECANRLGNEEPDNAALFASAFGFNQSTGKSTECPQVAGKDYFEKKKDAQKDMEDAQKQLADLEEDKAKLQEDFNKELQDIQESVNKAQEELEKQKLQINEDKRKRIASFQDQQNQNKETLRKKNTEVLDIKGKLISSQRDKAMKLVAMTDASGQRACMKEVNKARKDYQSVSSSTSGNHIATAKAKKADLLALYNDCMEIFEQQRTSLNESKRQEQEMLNKQLADVQSEIDELSGSMELASNQLNEMETDAQKEQSQAEEKVMKLMQTSQQKMVSAQETLNKKLQALQMKQQAAQQKLTNAQNDISQMGPIPKSRSATRTPEDAAEEIDTAASAMERLQTTGAGLDCSEFANLKSNKTGTKKTVRKSTGNR